MELNAFVAKVLGNGFSELLEKRVREDDGKLVQWLKHKKSFNLRVFLYVELSCVLYFKQFAKAFDENLSLFL